MLLPVVVLLVMATKKLPPIPTILAGGMSSMLTTVWLILCAMVFGAVEDGGTLTSPLIPWNTCGAYMSGTLGVATRAYLPYCFFNLINPLVAILYGYMNIKIAPAVPEVITTA